MAEADTTTEARDAFEQRLTREILVSERLRATLLAVIPSAAMIMFLVASSARPEVVSTLLRGQFDRLIVGLFLGVVAAYEFQALYAVEKLLRSGKKPSMLRRYGNAFIETSLPTCVVIYYVTAVGPVQALLMPTTFVYFVFIVLSTLRLDFSLCAFTGIVAAVEYAAVAVVFVIGDTSFAEPELASLPHHLGKACILFVSGVAAGFVARRLRKTFESALASAEERSRVVNLFGQHVSQAVVDKLLAQKAETRSEERQVCVVFVDIRNFTAFSEKRTPQGVVDFLNRVFEPAIECINRRHGIVNKFLGDGFMAVFGAPLTEGNPCEDATLAAIEIVARVDELAASGAIPPTRLSIGMHAGPAVIGNVGSASRKEYTVIGDVVNVASRVESLNRQLGSQVLATEEVWEASGKQVAGAAVAGEPIAVRGREKPVVIYRLA
jgi:adenylate cyclase